MKILLMGGTGQVSARVLSLAADAGDKVISITRGIQGIPDAPNVLHIKADRNQDDLLALCADINYDVVLDVTCQNPDHAQQSIDLSHNCRRLIMVSSDYAYEPDHRKLLMKEDEAVFSDRDDYGGNKHRAEKLIQEANTTGHIDGTILRPPHIYGPVSNPGTIPKHGRKPDLLKDITAGKTLQLLYGGLGLIQPIHADDFARIILKVIDKPASYGQAYNCTGPELMTHLDYYREIAKNLDRELKFTPYCPDETADDVSVYIAGHKCYDTTKINNLLPDFPYTTFADGMRDWVKQLREQSNQGS